MAKVLLTGGAGFIGSHTCVALIDAGFDVVIVDDFSNAARDVPQRIEQITGARVSVYCADVADGQSMDAIFAGHRFDAVIHFAARKSVPQSLCAPQGFFDTNIAGLLTLLRVMDHHAVTTLVYSSSATVYGVPEALPIPEHAPLSYTNPYGLSKLIGEQFVNQHVRGNPAWAAGVLRYFNPAGAHPSGLIGEDPFQPPTNLVPVMAQVATGRLPQIKIFGGDYPTEDGTGVRDYIHVEDLARGHVLSLEALLQTGTGHLVTLGTGRGHSVLDVLRAYEAVLGRDLPHSIVDRRPGDAAVSFASVARAQELLGFSARLGLAEMCASNWAFSGAQTADQVT